MSRKTKPCLISCLLIVFTLLSALPVCGADSKAILDGAFDFNVQSNGYSSLQEWADNAAYGDEWFVYAVAQSGENVNFEKYYSSLKNYVEGKENIATMDSLRIALAFVAIGARDDSFVLQTLEEHAGKQGIMSLVFGLHLVNNGIASSEFSAKALCDEIIALQGSDGGWSLDGKTSDVDVTAMVLQALAPCKELGEVELSADLAFAFLAGKQLEDGEFVSYGEKNSESAAQVILAITSWGRDPETDGEFIKNGRSLTEVLAGYGLSDGSFSHVQGGKTSKIATAQSACALVSVERLQNGDSSFFVMDAPSVFIETQTETQTLGYKFWVCSVVFVLALAGTVLVFVLKKTKKNILFIAIVAAAVVAFVLFTDISSEKNYYSSEREKGEPTGTVTIEVNCGLIAGQAEHVPEDGVLVSKREMQLYEGDTVYDVLSDVVKAEKLLFESQAENYIVAISNIGERQFGDLSGWIYYVNGERPSVGCGEYVLSDGDEIFWVYSLEMGKDVETEEN